MGFEAAMIAIDTNLLVYAHRRGTAEHRKAQAAIGRAASDPAGWGIPLACLAEFWSVVTHPASEGGPSSPAEASGFLQELVRTGAGVIWHPGVGFADRLLKLADGLKISGPRIFDLQIALTAFENGASEMWTHDREFLSVHGLRVVHPL